MLEKEREIVKNTNPSSTTDKYMHLDRFPPALPSLVISCQRTYNSTAVIRCLYAAMQSMVSDESMTHGDRLPAGVQSDCGDASPWLHADRKSVV